MPTTFTTSTTPDAIDDCLLPWSNELFISQPLTRPSSAALLVSACMNVHDSSHISNLLFPGRRTQPTIQSSFLPLSSVYEFTTLKGNAGHNIGGISGAALAILARGDGLTGASGCGSQTWNKSQWRVHSSPGVKSELYCMAVKQECTHNLLPFSRYSAKRSVSSMAAVT